MALVCYYFRVVFVNRSVSVVCLAPREGHCSDNATFVKCRFRKFCIHAIAVCELPLVPKHFRINVLLGIKSYHMARNEMINEGFLTVQLHATVLLESLHLSIRL